MHRLAAILVTSATAMLCTACGIATAPVSGPMAIAANANFDYSFRIVDKSNRPIKAVFQQNLNHVFWEPVVGQLRTDENVSKEVEGKVEVHERGTRMFLVFSEKYHRAQKFHIDARIPHLLQTEHGVWTYTDNFPVVLMNDAPVDEHLHLWTSTIDYSAYPTQRVISLLNLTGPNTIINHSFDKTFGRVSGPDSDRTNTLVLESTFYTQGVGTRANRVQSLDRGKPVFITTRTTPDNAPPFSIYLTQIPQSPRLDARGDIDPVEINLPERIALHAKGEQGGFISIARLPGFHPIVMADLAPATPYVNELVIDRERLRAMRLARPDHITDAFEYFYFRIGDHYGKGCIAWAEHSDPKSPRNTRLAFRVAFWMQSKPNDRSLVCATARFGFSFKIHR